MGVAPKTLFDANLSVSEAQAIIDLHGVECVNSVRDAKTRFSPLMMAWHSPDVVRLLIERGANVNFVAKRGLTPLMAVNHAESARRLVEAGARIDAIDDRRFTALLHSIDNRTIEKTRVLLELGADVNKKGRRDGRDVCAMGMAAKDFAVVEMLVSQGVDVNVLHYDDQGNSYHSPLHFAASAQWAQLLLDAGANLEALDQDKNTPLCLTRYFDVARTLLKAGANPNARNVYGRTPLHHARSVEWIKLLVAAGVDGKKCVDINGRTPLIPMVAEPDLLRAMVEIAGVDVSARDYQNQSVLAINNSNTTRHLQLLVELGADIDAPFVLQNNARNTSSLRILLACGIDCPAHYPMWLLSDGMDLLFAAGCETIGREGPPEGPPGRKRLEAAKRLIRRSRVDLIRDKTTSICIGLQSMDLPAWVTLQIVECACSPFSVCVPLFLKWELVTTVKHFEMKKKQQQ